jgi:tubulin alpha
MVVLDRLRVAPLEHLSLNHDNKSKLEFAVCSVPRVPKAVVEPYDYILAKPAMVEHSDRVLTIENEALYALCRHVLDIELRTYANLNRLIWRVTSSLTASIRFDRALQFNFTGF